MIGPPYGRILRHDARTQKTNQQTPKRPPVAKMDHSYEYHVRRFKPHRSSNWIRWMWRAHFWPKFRLKRMLGSKGSPHSSAYIWNFKAKISRSFIFLNVGYDYCVRRIKPNMSSNWIRAVWRAHFWLKFCVKRMLGSKASPYSLAYICLIWSQNKS